VVWRGPMLHRAFAAVPCRRVLGRSGRAPARPAARNGRHRHLGGSADPERGNPGGDYPQLAAAEVASAPAASLCRPASASSAFVENMSGLALPDGSTLQVFARAVAGRSPERLSRAVGAEVPAAGPDPAGSRTGGRRRFGRADRAERTRLRGRQGNCLSIADRLSSRRRGLAGVSLGLDPTRH